MKPQRIMYCATPTRLRHLAEEVKKIARNAGFVPIVPFDVGPYEDFEGNPRVGRERTLRLMMELQSMCDITGIFGISQGTMLELANALNKPQEVRLFPGIDPDWDTYYEKLSPTYGDLLQIVRGDKKLVIFVGPSAVGKTFWIDRLLARFSGSLCRVKSITTRKPRDERDSETYNFVSREEFERGLTEGSYIEHDRYLDNFYGSSWESVKNVLRGSHGIFAITPSGAVAFYNHRLEMNVRLVLLKPANESVLTRNLTRRGILGTADKKRYLERANLFTLPNHISHRVIEIKGETDLDVPLILEAVSSALNY